MKKRSSKSSTFSSSMGSRCTDELKHILRMLADANGESMSSVMRRAIERECAHLSRKLNRGRK